jgi:hypothetical protein
MVDARLSGLGLGSPLITSAWELRALMPGGRNKLTAEVENEAMVEARLKVLFLLKPPFFSGHAGLRWDLDPIGDPDGERDPGERELGLHRARASRTHRAFRCVVRGRS